MDQQDATPRSNRSSIEEGTPRALEDQVAVSAALQKVLESVPEDVAVTILRQSFCPAGPKPITLPIPPVRIPDVFLALPPALQSAALRACAPAVDEDQSLDISISSPACMEMLAVALPNLPALQAVQIVVSFEAPEEEPYGRMLRALCALPALTMLGLSDDSAMDHHILSLSAALLQAEGLRVLKLDVVPETPEVVGPPCALAFMTLQRMTRMHFATSETVFTIPEAFSEGTMEFPAMRELYFDKLFWEKRDLQALLSGRTFLPNIEALTLGYDADRYGFGAHDALDNKAMAEGSFLFPLLKDLCVRDYRSDTAGLAGEMLGRPHLCPLLTRLDLSFSLHRDDSGDVGRLLQEVPRLESLVLRQPGDYEGALQAEEYAAGLAGMVCLTHLDLSGSQLSGAGAAALAGALRALTALVSLSMNDALLLGGSLEENAAAENAMAQGLASIDGMRVLRLENCFLSPQPLTAAVEGMPQLRQLWLRGTVLGEGGGRLLGQGLAHMPPLDVLDLGQSLLDPPGLRALAPGLAGLAGLTQLILSYCQMGREGAAELAGALCPEAVAGKRQRGASVSQLVVLDVSYSRLGREGVAALLPALLKMAALRELNVQQGEPALSDGMLAELQAANGKLYVLR